MDIYKLPTKIFGFTKQGFWTLFLMAAFPTHVWTILLILQDFSWVSSRTNEWDAVGVGAYGLIVAFVESVFVFAIALLLSFLISRTWNADKRITSLSVLIFGVAMWAILNQLYFLLDFSIPDILFQILINDAHPLRILYGLCSVLIIVTVFPPFYLVLKSEKVFAFFQIIIERLSLLTTIYLILDIGALIIVVIRNL